MLLSTAKSEIRARLGETAADFWTDAELVRALNEGVARFSAEEKWPWLFTNVTGIALAANTPTLALQAGVTLARHFDMLITKAGDSRPRHPQRVSPQKGYELRLNYYIAQSEPGWYYLQAEAGATGLFTATVRFVPVMSVAVTIEYQYIRTPVAVAVDTDSLDIPEEYAMGAVAWACGELWLKELQFSGKADEQFGLYAQVLGQARKEIRRATFDTGVQWGGAEPQYDYPPDPVLLRMPPTLGP